MILSRKRVELCVRYINRRIEASMFLDALTVLWLSPKFLRLFSITDAVHSSIDLEFSIAFLLQPIGIQAPNLKCAGDHIDDPRSVLFEQDDIAKNNHPSQVPRQGRQLALKGGWKRLRAFP